jgi:hypothetical protein
MSRLTMQMIYKPDYKPHMEHERELWGTLILSLEDEILYKALAPIDKFIRWYIIALPYILSEPPIPFAIGKSYSQNIVSHLDTLSSEERQRVFNKSSIFHNMNSAFGDPRQPNIHIVKRGTEGEISLLGQVHDDNSKNIVFKSGAWAYLFDLSDFVTSSKQTIIKFLEDAKANSENAEVKKNIHHLLLMAESIQL